MTARPLLARLGQRLNRYFREERGATAVEFALVSPIVIAFLLAIMQVALVWYAKSILERATESAGRLVMTNQAANGGYTATQFTNALCAKVPALLSCPTGMMVNLTQAASLSAVSTTAPTLTYDANGNVSNRFSFTPGGPGNIMVLQVMYQFPVVGGPLFGWSTQSNGSLLLISTFVFENEPS